MGSLTTITILNDHLSRIKHDPASFVDSITSGMHGIHSFGNHPFGMSPKTVNMYPGAIIAKSHHADIPRLYFVYQNNMFSIGHDIGENNVEQRKKMLKQAKQLIKLEEEALEKLINKTKS